MRLKEMLEANKLKKNISKIVFLTLFILSLNSLSYAHFKTKIEGEGSKTLVTTNDMTIKFTDSEAIKKTGLTPGSTITKTFTIINNSDSNVDYKINWEYLINNFVGRENLVYTISSDNSGGTLSETQLPDSDEHINILDNLSINTGVTQNYTMTITYKDNGQNQDLDKSKSIIGKIEVTDIDGNSILPETSTENSASLVASEDNLYGLKMKDLVNVLYPVGSTYISTSSTNPSEIMGGSWESFGQGRTLIGVGTGTDTNSSSKTFNSSSTGGEYTHQVTTAEMPSHSHWFSKGENALVLHSTNDATRTPNYGFSYKSNAGWWFDANKNESTIANTGGSEFHNNVQPYIVTYMWKRIS